MNRTPRNQPARRRAETRKKLRKLVIQELESAMGGQEPTCQSREPVCQCREPHCIIKPVDN